MNAITLFQPWATLMADGWKTNETRSWKAYLRAIGQPLAIHAGARLMARPHQIGHELIEFMRSQYGSHWDLHLPLKAIVGVGVLGAVSRVVDTYPVARVAAVVPAHQPHSLGYDLTMDIFGITQRAGASGRCGTLSGWTRPSRSPAI